MVCDVPKWPAGLALCMAATQGSSTSKAEMQSPGHRDNLTRRLPRPLLPGRMGGISSMGGMGGGMGGEPGWQRFNVLRLGVSPLLCPVSKCALRVPQPRAPAGAAPHASASLCLHRQLGSLCPWRHHALSLSISTSDFRCFSLVVPTPAEHRRHGRRHGRRGALVPPRARGTGLRR